MNEDEILAEEERALAELVRAILAEVAEEILAEMDPADEITAAAFSLRRIGEIWRERVPRILARLFRTAERSVDATAESALDGVVPEGFDDLPARAEADTLPPAMQAYRASTEALLNAVGDRITEAASRALAEGLAANEDTEALKARLRAVLADGGAQLGESRAELIARTESTRAWNAAALALAEEAQVELGIDLVKIWNTREDDRVRETHRETEHASVALDATFTVGGTPMLYPGDPTAPMNEIANCRCRLSIERAPSEATAAADPSTSGDTMDEDDETSTEVHTGGMIALVPSAADAERIALEGDGALPVDELHLTLIFLGKAADWTPEQRAALTEGVATWAGDLGAPVAAKLFGVNLWNPGGDYPAWVYATGDAEGAAGVLASMQAGAVELAGGLAPEQHSPFAAHVTAAVTTDPWPLEPMAERLGPIVFDRIRVAFAGEYTDYPLGEPVAQPEEIEAAGDFPVRTWSNPDDTALAYEDEQTGDGRVFSPESLYWDGDGPWPLQYCDRMGAGHDGAALAGAMQTLARDGSRITSSGPLYTSQYAGWEVAMLLDQGAPLGVSVDLDDVTMEILAKPGLVQEDVDLAASGAVRTLHFAKLSVLATDAGWSMSATGTPVVTASASGVARSASTVEFTLSQEGGLPIATVRALTAAAGEADPTDGDIVDSQSSDDFTTRITKGRIRGATLVPIPAFSRARIVIDPLPEIADEDRPALMDDESYALSASGASLADAVIGAVRASVNPLSPVEIATQLGASVTTVRRHLREAAEAGRIGKLGRLYIGLTLAEGELSASVVGDDSLTVHPDREAEWDGDKAATAVAEWAQGDEAKLKKAFLYQDPDADPQTLAAYKLGLADVFDGELHIVPAAVFAIAGALQGARGGVDVPEDEMPALRAATERLYERVSEALGEEHTVPWADEGEDADDEMTASAWTEMQALPPMPAAWFKEPTAEELPPGSGGVHYKDGRVYGWVAQAGVPHAAHGRKVTIDKLAGDRGLDYSHFLRQRFTLDDGSEVRAGAFTMNVGHHRDGYECETAACQFDDSRTVAAVVTVGMNAGGLWFSGAAGPWLADWDRTVFTTTQPSYHLTQGGDGRWQLKAVLSVPVPGHSSPLVASFVERSNLALTASAAARIEADAMAEVAPAAPAPETFTAEFLDKMLDAMAVRAAERAASRAAALAKVNALAATLGLDAPATTEGA